MNKIFFALLKLKPPQFGVVMMGVAAAYYFLLFDNGARFDQQAAQRLTEIRGPREA